MTAGRPRDLRQRLVPPGSRIERLLVLLRIAPAAAIRKSGQRPHVSLGLGVLYLGPVTAATLYILPQLIGIDDDQLRRQSLYLSAGLITILWFPAQILLRLPLTWLLDLRSLLTLPVGFRDLYLLRLGLSAFGYWLLFLAPAAAYLLVTQSAGVAGFLLNIAALLTVVLVLGRLAGILDLAANDLVSGWLGPLGIALLSAAFFNSVTTVFEVILGEASLERAATAVNDSALLAAVGLTPPGLLIAMFDSPGAVLDNVLRLLVLVAALFVASLIERSLLLRNYVSRPSAAHDPASPTLPLTWIFRRMKYMSPPAHLTLIESETVLRWKRIRLCYAVAVGYATYPTADFELSTVFIVLLALALFNSIRIEKPLPGCQVWRESLTLPLTTLRIVRIPGRVPPLLAGCVLLVVLVFRVIRGNWTSWEVGGLIAGCLLSVFLLSGALYSNAQLHWQRRGGPGKPEADAKNLLASLLAGLPVYGAVTLIMFVLLADGETKATASAGAGVAVILLGATIVRLVAAARQRRAVATRAHELLLEERPPERPFTNH